MRAIMAAAVLVISTTTLGWSGPATAQDGWGWSTIIPSVTGTDQLGLHLRDQMARQQGSGKEADNPARSAPQAANTDPAVLRYTPSKARRTANLARFVEATRRVDPATAASMQTLFASGDIIEKIGGLLAPHGMRVNDLPDVYSIWWITAWQATKGSITPTSDQTNRAVRGQAASALGGISTIVQASDAAKQELAESLLIQTALVEAMAEQAKGNPSQLKAMAGAVRQGALGMGIDLSTMELTEQGFVIASK